ncbi:ABC transporter ATP-binding protein [Brevibacillus sp. NRS-1366]|uniref:ABC transporter ATP-binding protein n=1 Tax=Brevibacillus sp. NRS-1366 TaxID=3233899 RepID=UPI003D1BB623
MNNEPLIEIEHLTVEADLGRRKAILIEDLSFSINSGEIVGIVGESGSGKSMTAMAIMGLLPPNVRVTKGRILYRGQDLLKMSKRELRKLRGSEIGLILQDPLTSLDPLFRVDSQIREVLREHRDDVKDEREEVVNLLRSVSIPDPERRSRQYPHELSGGMRQRVVGAIGMAGNPRLLIADEPTTALDVTVQAGFLQLLEDLKEEKGLTVMIISHDYGVINRVADKVIVMYAGAAVEQGSVREVWKQPQHPYTKGLMDSLPRLGMRLDRLYSIPGAPPIPGEKIDGCHFAPRCDKALDRCHRERPDTIDGKTTFVRCFLSGGAQ